jgi:type 1 fimbriae regulatory protein FimB/type 1 fimbriae regulatory protein FimE
LDTEPAPALISRPRGTAYQRPAPGRPPGGERLARHLAEHAKQHAESPAQPEPRREWLTEDEVEAIIKHASNPRDKLMILLAYRHGLRVTELISLRWQQIDLEAARLKVHRLKNGEPSVHPVSGRELRALRSLRRGMGPNARWVFVTERKLPMTRNGFYKLLSKAAERAGLSDVHPHLLRHATGFKLVNQGLDTLSLAAYLGHSNIQNTKRYTKMNSTRFDGLWRD